MHNLSDVNNPYLAQSDVVDWQCDAVQTLAASLAVDNEGQRRRDDAAIARQCFEWVRDQVGHSWDHQTNPVTCCASDVLQHRTGYCYSKSHLLVALLRANGISAGFCYQRLSVGDTGAPYCLHGLVAVHLADYGWYRIDPRGNKPGVNAQFTPPIEQLAYPIQDDQEADLPEIWPEPLPLVVEVLTTYSDIAEVHRHLPDIPLAC